MNYLVVLVCYYLIGLGLALYYHHKNPPIGMMRFMFYDNKFLFLGLMPMLWPIILFDILFGEKSDPQIATCVISFGVIGFIGMMIYAYYPPVPWNLGPDNRSVSLVCYLGFRDHVAIAKGDKDCLIGQRESGKLVVKTLSIPECSTAILAYLDRGSCQSSAKGF